MTNYDTIDWAEGDTCPVHDTPHKKTYTFGSTMSAETDVCTFRGCRCAVAIKHDPVGTYQAVATYCIDYDTASSIGRLHAMQAAVKYR